MSELWGLITPRAKGTVVNRAYRGSADMEPMDSRHLDYQHYRNMEYGSTKLRDGILRLLAEWGGL